MYIVKQLLSIKDRHSVHVLYMNFEVSHVECVK